MSAPFVHESAWVDEGATLESDVRVWHFCHISPGAHLGQGASLGQGVYVAPGVHIGAGCRVQNGVSLYEGVHLERDVFVGPHASFTNVRVPRAHVSRRHAFEPTHLARGVSVGANATIVCGVRLGAYAMVGAGAVVTKDVAPYALVVGNPARFLGWVCACGERLGHALRCESCGQGYRLQGESLLPI